MPYRNLPREDDSSPEKKGYTLKSLLQGLKCATGTHEYAFQHEPMPLPNWQSDSPYKLNLSWLTMTGYGLEYYKATVFCPHCHSVFKGERVQERYTMLLQNGARFTIAQYNVMIVAWEKYVKLHELGSLLTTKMVL